MVVVCEICDIDAVTSSAPVVTAMLGRVVVAVEVGKACVLTSIACRGTAIFRAAIGEHTVGGI